MFQKYFIIYLISINILSFIICYIDKIRSIKNYYRISEGTLLFISFIGGAFGMAISMNMFHHKTKKFKFKLVYLLCSIWVYIIYVYYF